MFSYCTAHKKPDTGARQRRLERLEEIFPSTEYIKWYKADQISHPYEWQVDRENQVWYVIHPSVSSVLFTNDREVLSV
jgi:hypothetical protein